MSVKDVCRLRPEGATGSYLFGQGKISILSGKSQRILKSDFCGSHVSLNVHCVFSFRSCWQSGKGQMKFMPSKC